MLTHFRTPGRDARIGAEVARLRRKRGMTQTKLAAAVGMSLSMLSKLEIGDRHWTLEAISETALALDIPAALIFGASLETLVETIHQTRAESSRKIDSVDKAQVEHAVVKHRKRKGGKKGKTRDHAANDNVLDLSSLAKVDRDLVTALHSLLASRSKKAA